MNSGAAWPALLLGVVALGIIWWAARTRRRHYEQFRRARDMRFTLHGPPVTWEMQQLFGAYGQDRVEGVVQLRDGLQVGYANGVQLTFVPVHTGGKVGAVGESRACFGERASG